MEKKGGGQKKKKNPERKAVKDESYEKLLSRRLPGRKTETDSGIYRVSGKREQTGGGGNSRRGGRKRLWRPRTHSYVSALQELNTKDQKKKKEHSGGEKQNAKKGWRRTMVFRKNQPCPEKRCGSPMVHIRGCNKARKEVGKKPTKDGEPL